MVSPLTEIKNIHVIHVFVLSFFAREKREKRSKSRFVVDVGGQKNQEIDIYHMCTHARTCVHVKSSSWLPHLQESWLVVMSIKDSESHFYQNTLKRLKSQLN